MKNTIFAFTFIFTLMTGFAVGIQTAQAATVNTIATGFSEITDLQAEPGSTDRLWVIQKGGTVTAYSMSQKTKTQLGSFSVRTSSEQGLLGLAFHPDFKSNGLVYINHNPSDGNARTQIAECVYQSGTLRLSRVLLEIEQPYSNHKGGQIAFGPDRKLYIGTGDGGSGGDPGNRAQNPASLLGKMLRIDPTPSGSLAYTVPSDNPFVGRAGYRGEIWALGLRNPWRFTFGPQGELVTGDVGQNRFEEIDIVPRGGNLGWNIREGRTEYRAVAASETPVGPFVEPIWIYGRSDGFSVTGGIFSNGLYYFADFGSGRIWSLNITGNIATETDAQLVLRTNASIATFGKGPRGEILLGDFRGNQILELVP